jgi:hypothetical protein
MRRFALAALVALVTAASCFWVAPGREARAVAPSQIVGAYRIRMKGDGWLRGTSEAYRSERVLGFGTLVLSRNTPDDGKLHVEIQLDDGLTGSLLDLATPEPAFVGDAAVVGDSLAIIDSGGPTYVNALTMTFFRGGGRIVGHWVSSFPAADSVLGAASGVGIDFVGRRVRGQGLDHRR